MKIIRNYRYYDAPIVSSELVKYLAINSEFEVVNQLQQTVSNSLIEIKSAQKDARDAKKAADTALKKLDQQLKDLSKRLKVLKSKVWKKNGVDEVESSPITSRPTSDIFLDEAKHTKACDTLFC